MPMRSPGSGSVMRRGYHSKKGRLIMTLLTGQKEGRGRWKRWRDYAATHQPALVLALVLLLMIDGSIALIAWPRGVEKVAPAEPVALAVKVREVVLTNLQDVVVYTGRVEAEHDARLAVDDNGRIVWLGVEQGERVKAGQVLLRLDDAAAVAGLARAEVQLKQAEEDVARWEAMKKAGAVSDLDYEGVRNRRDLARITVEEAKGLLGKRRVTSPVDGVVDERMVELGEMAMPGKPAFRVVKADRVKVIVDIPETDVAAMKVGLPLGFALDALPGAGLTGVVSYVSAAAQEASLTFRMELSVENTEGRIKPGMMARVSLRRRETQGAMAVPLQALIPNQGQYVAYVVVDGRAVRRVVKLSTVVDTLAVVQSGLRPGDGVVIEGQRLAADGMSVKVVP